MKKFYLLLLLSFLCFIFTGCKKSENESFKIVTSCYPVYVMALNIVKDTPGVEVINMCENNVGCLHNFQLKSEDLKKIEKSSVFVINGAGMESFLDKLLNELPSIKIIDSGINIDLLKDDDHEEHEGCHDVHEYNPHIWMSVSNYIKQVENIKNSLVNLDSIHKENYEKNSELYIKKLEALKEKISKELSGIKNRNIITFHEAFVYFAKEFNLNILGVINQHPGEEPDMKSLKESIDLIKENNIKSIFAETQYSKEAANIIASETGAKVYTLNSAVTGNKNDENSYINAMEENLKVLTEALK